MVLQMMVETYLRRGQRGLQRMLLKPGVRSAAAVAAYGGSGFLLSGASLAGFPQPLAAGLICAGTGWRALVMSLGAMLGYPSFWGMAGRQGIVWSASAGLLALLLGKRQETRQQPLMIPAIAAFLICLTGLVFGLLLRDRVPLILYGLRILLTFLSGVLFTQAVRQRAAVTDWLVGCVAVLALAQAAPVPWLSLGYLAAGILAVRGSFPAAVLAGLGLDLSQVTKVPMAAVLGAAGLVRMIPFDKRWQHYASGGFAYLGVMAACGIWDPLPLPGLLAGGALSALLPPRPAAARSRGQTGAAQVRLELSAAALGTAGDILLEHEPPPPDMEGIFQRAVDRACGSCPAREGCRERGALSVTVLEEASGPGCRESTRLAAELERAGEQLRYLRRDRQRHLEYRRTLVQQYRFLEGFLRQVADSLPGSGHGQRAGFRVEAAARSRQRKGANGDRCLAFPGPDCRFFLLLCDGMGTGLGAAREGSEAAAQLRRLLESGFPPDQALQSLNSLLLLSGAGGAVTVDLAEIRLDTGQASVYKWGAAPSWLLDRKAAKKIGTATAPPGYALEQTLEKAEKLSLCRGEVLILLSDGVDGEGVLHRLSLTPDAPPGELAADILEKGCPDSQDDATAAVLRLRPVSLGSS